MLDWSRDEDRWLRRTSVICQLASKGATDTDLLTRFVEANVEDHPALSGLSRREALKHL